MSYELLQSTKFRITDSCASSGDSCDALVTSEANRKSSMQHGYDSKSISFSFRYVLENRTWRAVPHSLVNIEKKKVTFHGYTSLPFAYKTTREWRIVSNPKLLSRYECYFADTALT
jgi:hypothetical protein